MNVHGSPECQLASRLWQTGVDFLSKERVLVAWEGEMRGHARGSIEGLAFELERWILIETANIY